MRRALRILLPALALVLCLPAAPLMAQPEALIGAKAVTAVTYDEVKTALVAVGLSDVGDQTADPKFPTFGGHHSDGVNLQATLFACDTAAQRCRGVELAALIPATSLRNAQVIVGSIERSAFSIDAQFFDLPNGPDSYAVMISSYLVYDYGVSEQLLSIALGHFASVIGQTKGFMLKDDPAHAELWSRKN
jgi:hypothetical protein